MGILKHVIAAGAVACNERSVEASGLIATRIGFAITSGRLALEFRAVCGPETALKKRVTRQW
ncbi:MAG TPA: hypothetical protein VM656_03960 [Pyrinomonadaceae bacterium]|nr:hypothetical protein [Pyrinomonadaceae bacterium]